MDEDVDCDPKLSAEPRVLLSQKDRRVAEFYLKIRKAWILKTDPKKPAEEQAPTECQHGSKTSTQMENTQYKSHNDKTVIGRAIKVNSTNTTVAPNKMGKLFSKETANNLSSRLKTWKNSNSPSTSTASADHSKDDSNKKDSVDDSTHRHTKSTPEDTSVNSQNTSITLPRRSLKADERHFNADVNYQRSYHRGVSSSRSMSPSSTRRPSYAHAVRSHEGKWDTGSLSGLSAGPSDDESLSAKHKVDQCEVIVKYIPNGRCRRINIRDCAVISRSCRKKPLSQPATHKPGGADFPDLGTGVVDRLNDLVTDKVDDDMLVSTLDNSALSAEALLEFAEMPEKGSLNEDQMWGFSDSDTSEWLYTEERDVLDDCVEIAGRLRKVFTRKPRATRIATGLRKVAITEVDHTEYVARTPSVDVKSATQTCNLSPVKSTAIVSEEPGDMLSVLPSTKTDCLESTFHVRDTASLKHSVDPELVSMFGQTIEQVTVSSLLTVIDGLIADDIYPETTRPLCRRFHVDIHDPAEEQETEVHQHYEYREISIPLSDLSWTNPMFLPNYEPTEVRLPVKQKRPSTTQSSIQLTPTSSNKQVSRTSKEKKAISHKRKSAGGVVSPSSSSKRSASNVPEENPYAIVRKSYKSESRDKKRNLKKIITAADEALLDPADMTARQKDRQLLCRFENISTGQQSNEITQTSTLPDAFQSNNLDNLLQDSTHSSIKVEARMASLDQSDEMLYSGTGDVAESGGSDDDGLCISQVWSMDSDPKTSPANQHNVEDELSKKSGKQKNVAFKSTSKTYGLSTAKQRKGRVSKLTSGKAKLSNKMKRFDKSVRAAQYIRQSVQQGNHTLVGQPSNRGTARKTTTSTNKPGQNRQSLSNMDNHVDMDVIKAHRVETAAGDVKKRGRKRNTSLNEEDALLEMYRHANRRILNKESQTYKDMCDPMYGLIEEIGASKRGGLSNALNRAANIIEAHKRIFVIQVVQKIIIKREQESLQQKINELKASIHHSHKDEYTGRPPEVAPKEEFVSLRDYQTPLIGGVYENKGSNLSDGVVDAMLLEKLVDKMEDFVADDWNHDEEVVEQLLEEMIQKIEAESLLLKIQNVRSKCVSAQDDKDEVKSCVENLLNKIAHKTDNTPCSKELVFSQFTEVKDDREEVKSCVENLLSQIVHKTDDTPCSQTLVFTQFAEVKSSGSPVYNQDESDCKPILNNVEMKVEDGIDSIVKPMEDSVTILLDDLMLLNIEADVRDSVDTLIEGVEKLQQCNAESKDDNCIMNFDISCCSHQSTSEHPSTSVIGIISAKGESADIIETSKEQVHMGGEPCASPPTQPLAVEHNAQPGKIYHAGISGDDQKLPSAVDATANSLSLKHDTSEDSNTSLQLEDPMSLAGCIQACNERSPAEPGNPIPETDQHNESIAHGNLYDEILTGHLIEHERAPTSKDPHGGRDRCVSCSTDGLYDDLVCDDHPAKISDRLHSIEEQLPSSPNAAPNHLTLTNALKSGVLSVVDSVGYDSDESELNGGHLLMTVHEKGKEDMHAEPKRLHLQSQDAYNSGSDDDCALVIDEQTETPSIIRDAPKPPTPESISIQSVICDPDRSFQDNTAEAGISKTAADGPPLEVQDDDIRSIFLGTEDEQEMATKSSISNFALGILDNSDEDSRDVPLILGDGYTVTHVSSHIGMSDKTGVEPVDSPEKIQLNLEHSDYVCESMDKENRNTECHMETTDSATPGIPEDAVAFSSSRGTAEDRTEEQEVEDHYLPSKSNGDLAVKARPIRDVLASVGLRRIRQPMVPSHPFHVHDDMIKKHSYQLPVDKNTTEHTVKSLLNHMLYAVEKSRAGNTDGRVLKELYDISFFDQEEVEKGCHWPEFPKRVPELQESLLIHDAHKPIPSPESRALTKKMEMQTEILVKNPKTMLQSICCISSKLKKTAIVDMKDLQVMAKTMTLKTLDDLKSGLWKVINSYGESGSYTVTTKEASKASNKGVYDRRYSNRMQEKEFSRLKQPQTSASKILHVDQVKKKPKCSPVRPFILHDKIKMREEARRQQAMWEPLSVQRTDEDEEIDVVLTSSEEEEDEDNLAPTAEELSETQKELTFIQMDCPELLNDHDYTNLADPSTPRRRERKQAMIEQRYDLTDPNIRETHNQLEKIRRAALSKLFVKLGRMTVDQPGMRLNGRVSKLTILNMSRLYIGHLRGAISKHKQTWKDEVDKNHKLFRRLKQVVEKCRNSSHADDVLRSLMDKQHGRLQRLKEARHKVMEDAVKKRDTGIQRHTVPWPTRAQHWNSRAQHWNSRAPHWNVRLSESVSQTITKFPNTKDTSKDNTSKTSASAQKTVRTEQESTSKGLPDKFHKINALTQFAKSQNPSKDNRSQSNNWHYVSTGKGTTVGTSEFVPDALLRFGEQLRKNLDLQPTKKVIVSARMAGGDNSSSLPVITNPRTVPRVEPIKPVEVIRSFQIIDGAVKEVPKVIHYKLHGQTPLQAASKTVLINFRPEPSQPIQKQSSEAHIKKQPSKGIKSSQNPLLTKAMLMERDIPPLPIIFHQGDPLSNEPAAKKRFVLSAPQPDISRSTECKVMEDASQSSKPVATRQPTRPVILVPAGMSTKMAHRMWSLVHRFEPPSLPLQVDSGSTEDRVKVKPMVTIATEGGNNVSNPELHPVKDPADSAKRTLEFINSEEADENFATVPLHNMEAEEQLSPVNVAKPYQSVTSVDENSVTQDCPSIYYDGKPFSPDQPSLSSCQPSTLDATTPPASQPSYNVTEQCIDRLNNQLSPGVITTTGSSSGVLSPGHNELQTGIETCTSPELDYRFIQRDNDRKYSPQRHRKPTLDSLDTNSEKPSSFLVAKPTSRCNNDIILPRPLHMTKSFADANVKLTEEISKSSVSLLKNPNNVVVKTTKYAVPYKQFVIASPKFIYIPFCTAKDVKKGLQPNSSYIPATSYTHIKSVKATVQRFEYGWHDLRLKNTHYAAPFDVLDYTGNPMSVWSPTATMEGSQLNHYEQPRLYTGNYIDISEACTPLHYVSPRSGKVKNAPIISGPSSSVNYTFQITSAKALPMVPRDKEVIQKRGSIVRCGDVAIIDMKAHQKLLFSDQLSIIQQVYTTKYRNMDILVSSKSNVLVLRSLAEKSETERPSMTLRYLKLRDETLANLYCDLGQNYDEMAIQATQKLMRRYSAGSVRTHLIRLGLVAPKQKRQKRQKKDPQVTKRKRRKKLQEAEDEGETLADTIEIVQHNNTVEVEAGQSRVQFVDDDYQINKDRTDKTSRHPATSQSIDSDEHNTESISSVPVVKYSRSGRKVVPSSRLSPDIPKITKRRQPKKQSRLHHTLSTRNELALLSQKGRELEVVPSPMDSRCDGTETAINEDAKLSINKTMPDTCESDSQDIIEVPGPSITETTQDTREDTGSHLGSKLPDIAEDDGPNIMEVTGPNINDHEALTISSDVVIESDQPVRTENKSDISTMDTVEREAIPAAQPTQVEPVFDTIDLSQCGYKQEQASDIEDVIEIPN